MKASVSCITYYGQIKMYKDFQLRYIFVASTKTEYIMTQSLLNALYMALWEKLRMTRNQSSVMDACVVLQGVQILE